MKCINNLGKVWPENGKIQNKYDNAFWYNDGLYLSILRRVKGFLTVSLSSSKVH